MIILLRIVCSVQSGITSPKLPPIAVQYTGHLIHVTTILLCYWRKFWWRNTRLYKLSLVFGIILTQFYINFSRQEHQIDVLYVSLKFWDSQVSAYTPFHFSFTVPLTEVKTFELWILGSSIDLHLMQIYSLIWFFFTYLVMVIPWRDNLIG